MCEIIYIYFIEYTRIFNVYVHHILSYSQLIANHGITMSRIIYEKFKRSANVATRFWE